jgi:hypothetical protein
VKTKIKRDTFDDLFFVQALMKQLKRDDWKFNYQQDDNEKLTHLFFCRDLSRVVFLCLELSFFVSSCLANFCMSFERFLSKNSSVKSRSLDDELHL